MKQNFDISALRQTAADIQGAVQPKSITPDMVGSVLAGIIDAIEQKQETVSPDNPIRTNQIADAAVTKSKLSGDLQAMANISPRNYITVRIWHRENSYVSLNYDDKKFGIGGKGGMTAMYYGATPQKSFSITGDAAIIYFIDVRGLDTSCFTTMRAMFYNCSNVRELYVANFNTGNVQSFRSMFNHCSCLRRVDVARFRTTNVTDMAYMFNYCSSLTELDLSNFATDKVVSMNSMFYSCKSLTYLNLAGFSTKNVSSMDYMFKGCANIETLILGDEFFATQEVSSIDFTSLVKWNDESIKESLVVNSYDRAAHKLPTMILQLAEQTKAILTDEDKQTITGKGYTIA